MALFNNLEPHFNLNEARLACIKAEYSHLGTRRELGALPRTAGHNFSRKRSALSTGCKSTQHTPWGEMGSDWYWRLSWGSVHCCTPLQGSIPGLACIHLYCALLAGQTPKMNSPAPAPVRLLEERLPVWLALALWKTELRSHSTAQCLKDRCEELRSYSTVRCLKDCWWW